MFMQNLDSTVIATALPTIARALDESPLRLNVAITCYLLSLAVFIPTSGWTADRFGARRVFSTAIVVFTLGSIGCGCATSLPALVASRIVQGMGGAMMVPVGRLVLLRTVEKSDLVRAMSYVSVPALIGPVMGPPLGGFIVSYASWRWIFFINIPIGILGIVLVNLLFGDLKEFCRLTDGNLSQHLQMLQEAKLVEISKGFEANRPLTRCRITAQGRRRYLEYLGVLEQVVRDAAGATKLEPGSRALRKLAPA